MTARDDCYRWLAAQDELSTGPTGYVANREAWERDLRLELSRRTTPAELEARIREARAMREDWAEVSS